MKLHEPWFRSQENRGVHFQEWGTGRVEGGLGCCCCRPPQEADFKRDLKFIFPVSWGFYKLIMPYGNKSYIL